MFLSNWAFFNYVDNIWTPTYVRLHFLPYKSWQKVNIFGLPTLVLTYLPRLVNVVKECPTSKTEVISQMKYFMSYQPICSVITLNSKLSPKAKFSIPFSGMLPFSTWVPYQLAQSFVGYLTPLWRIFFNAIQWPG